MTTPVVKQFIRNDGSQHFNLDENNGTGAGCSFHFKVAIPGYEEVKMVDLSMVQYMQCINRYMDSKTYLCGLRIKTESNECDQRNSEENIRQ
jgi:hypothetical protein